MGGLLDDQLAAAEISGPQLESADVENVERDGHATAGLTEEVLLGHPHVVQIDGDGRRALDAELVLLGSGAQTLGAALDQKGGDTSAFEVGKDHVEVGPAAVGDPHLAAVEVKDESSSLRRAVVLRFVASEPLSGSVRA